MLRIPVLALVVLACITASVPAQEALPAQETHDALGDPLPWGATKRYGTPRMRQGGYLPAIAAHPSGDLFATGAAAHGVSLWDVHTGILIDRHGDYNGAVLALAFLPDGERFVAVTSSGVFHIRSVESGEKIESFQNSEVKARGIRLCDDGNTAYVMTTEKIFRWNIGTGEVTMAVDTGNPNRFMTVSHDGKLAITRSERSISPTLWNTETGLKVKDFQRPRRFTHRADFHPDNKHFIMSNNNGSWSVWHIDQEEALREIEGFSEYTYPLEVSPDGKTVMVADNNGACKLFDFATGKMLHDVTTGQEAIQVVCFSADNRYAFFGGRQGATTVVDVESGRQLPSPENYGFHLHDFTMVPNSYLVITWGQGGGAVLRKRDDMTEVTRLLPEGEFVQDLVVSPDGTTAVAAYGNYRYTKGITVWDAQTGEEKAHWSYGRCWRPQNIAISPDGSKLVHLSLTREFAGLEITDTKTGEVVSKGTPPGELIRGDKLGSIVCWNPSQNQVVFAGISGDEQDRTQNWLTLWDGAPSADPTRAKMRQSSVLRSSSGLRQMFPHPDGKRIITNGPIFILRTKDCVPTAQLCNSGADVRHLALHPDGRLLAGVLSQKLFVWDLETGHYVRTWQPDDIGVSNVGWLDKKTLLVSTRRGTGLVVPLKPIPRREIVASAIEAKAGGEKAVQTAVRRLWRQLGQAPDRQELAREEFIALGDAVLPEFRALMLKARLEVDARAIAVQEAIEKLSDKSNQTRQAAAKHLGKAGLAAEKPLKELLARGGLEQDVYDNGQRLLENINAKRQYLQQTEHVLLQAMEILGLIGTPDALQILKEEALGLADNPVAQAARGVLARMEDTPQAP